jgi:hypothetical protein
MSAVEDVARAIRREGFIVDTSDGYPLVSSPETLAEKKRLLELMGVLKLNGTIVAEGVILRPR